MNPVEPEDGLITQYLLGALPPDETERLDELGIADDEFAGRLQALENDLVDAYVGGQLSGTTLDRFQSFYLASPRRRARVELARSLRDCAVADSRAGPARPRREWLWQWGLAAAVLVAAWLGLENRGLRHERDGLYALQKEKEDRRSRETRAKPAPAPAIVAFHFAPPTRGIAATPSIGIPAAADYVAFELELETVGYTGYQADLKALPERQPVWKSGKVEPYRRNDSRMVTVSFSAKLLDGQEYLLELAGITVGGSEEPVAGYPFRVVRK